MALVSERHRSGTKGARVTRLSASGRPARGVEQSAAVPAAAARAARGDRPEHPRRRRRAAARARPRRRVRRLAHHRAQGHRRARERGPAGAPPGLGHFRARRVEKNFSKLTSFSEDMRARGRKPRSDWLKRSNGTVTPGGSADAALEPRHAGVSLPPAALRGRRADGARVRDRSSPTACRRSTPWRPRSTRRSSAPGNRPVRALQRLRAVLLTREQAELLRAKPGDAGLLVERLGFLQDGRAVEFSQSYYRGDTYDFVAELSTP